MKRIRLFVDKPEAAGETTAAKQKQPEAVTPSKPKTKAARQAPRQGAVQSSGKADALGQASSGTAAITSKYAVAPELGRYARLKVPLMSPEQASKLTVPFAKIRGRLRSVLAEHGVAIVTDVASPGECNALETSFAQDLAELVDASAANAAGTDIAAASQAALEDVKKWPLASLQLLGPMERCQGRGLAHGRFAWGARLLPRVRAVYKALHGTEELVASCDNSFFAPLAHAKAPSNRVFPHVDQNAHDARFIDETGQGMGDWESFQGILYIWGSPAEHASTTIVWPGSHTTAWPAMMSDEKVQRCGKQGRHFTMIAGLGDVQEAARLMAGWQQEARRVPMPAGALLLWDSKTMHQSWRGGPRLAQPVCWEPASRRPAVARERKLRLAALGLPSTHWASLGFPHTMLGAGPAPDEPSKARKDKAGIALPLRASLRPQPLAAGAEPAEMWRQLRAAPWAKPLPADLRALLEESICEGFKAYM